MDTGAHFYRCDFQIHSPRDLKWQGARPVTDAERRLYADDFVAACRSRHLDAVAITDHHDLAFFRYIKDAAERETNGDGALLPPEKRLIVYPGLELSLAIPCQALLILDAGFPVGFLQVALTALGVQPADASEERHAEVRPLDFKDLERLHDALDRQEMLRGRYIVLPHVGDRGYKTLLRAGFHQHYQSMPCVGGYVDGDIPVPPKAEGQRLITNGKDKSWGNKAIGMFQTSDSRSRDFAKLGNHATWVKWAEPTAEALRQACLARYSRITHEAPELPESYIRRVTVSNSRFLGPVSLELNQQYNAFIGGRGTGKSTLLEYIRWALCDQPAQGLEGEEIPDFQRRRKDLIEKTLRPDDEVEVEFVANGITHVVRRKPEGGQLVLKVGANDFRTCAPGDVAGILPVQAYSQKQLSNVGVKVEELSRFVQIPIRSQLERLRSSMEDIKAVLRQLYIELLSERRLRHELGVFDLEEASLAKQLAELRGRLNGLSGEDRRVIAEQEKYVSEQEVVDDWRLKWSDVRSALSASLSQVSAWTRRQTSVSTELPNAELLIKIETDFRGHFEALESTIQCELNKLDQAHESFALEGALLRLDEWKQRRDTSKAAYDAAKERASAHQSTLGKLRELETNLEALRKRRDERKRALAQKSTVAKDYEKARLAWLELHNERTQLLAKQCAKLGELSAQMIRAHLRTDLGVARDELQNMVRGSKVRAEKFDAIYGAIDRAPDPLSAWGDVLGELEQLAMLSPADAESGALPQTPLLVRAGCTPRDRRALAAKLTPENWINLLLIAPDRVPVFEYRAREADYIGFHLASAGQQATALMSVLLNQDGPPLIIDQPEDDLDNQVMNEIVERLWSAKRKRQLIFASHNANLVVNGDAELVAWFDYRTAGEQSAGEIKRHGAIDVANVRDGITRVMEGGRAAFALRQAKYGF